MERTVRIGVIGGGSVFTPELVELLAANTNAIGAIELRLMDIDPRRLEIVGGLCRRLVVRAGTPVSLRDVASYEQAIDGADFVLAQFRQGGVTARIVDEKLGLKHRLPFTETISVCGFATFLRTYPEVERIAGLVQRLAPDAWVMNFTNPAGQLAETFATLGCRKVVGVCNAPLGLLDSVAKMAGAAPDDLFMTWRGLNHLTFTDAIYYRGQDLLPDILARWEEFAEHSEFPADLVRTLGAIPNGYLQYYYLRDRVIPKLQAQPKVRSEIVKEVEGVLLERFAAMDTIPEELAQRGGYGYSRLVALLIRGLLTNDHAIRYCIVRNGATLRELPEDAFVEVPVMVLADQIRAVQVDPLPIVARGLVVTMKDYERLCIQAARERSRRLLLQALLVHPLIGTHDGAAALLADVLEANRQYLPAFS